MPNPGSKNAKFEVLFIVSRKFKCQTVNTVYKILMPNSNKIENFQCQTLLKNVSFVKSGIEKCQLATVASKSNHFDKGGKLKLSRERKQKNINLASSGKSPSPSRGVARGHRRGHVVFVCHSHL